MALYNEAYRFVPWQQTLEGDGYEPALPDGVYCELLAEFGYGGKSGPPHDALYLVRWPEASAEPPGMKAVSDRLVKLLSSGRRYPPAIAIARDVRYKAKRAGWSAPEAVERFTDNLRDELDNQRDRPFFLAKAVSDDTSDFYKTAGKYYWILRYDPNAKEELWWVSSDYFVYTASVNDFDVDTDWLVRRFTASETSDAKS